MKAFIMHVVLAWQVTLITPEEQRTILLQFDSEQECVSIAKQVSDQVKEARSLFYLKSIACYTCRELLGAKSKRCPPPSALVKKPK